MKNVLFVSLIFSLLLMACSKKEPVNTDEVQELKPHYDTTAIDSFSAGATSVDIVAQIRMSSQKYRDSVKEALRLQKEEKKLKEELEKENKQQKAAEQSTANETKTE